MGVFLLLSISTQSLGWEVSVPAAVQSSKYGCAAVRFPGHREIDRSVPSNPRERDGGKELAWQDWGLSHEKLPSVLGQREASIPWCIRAEG